VQLENGEQKSLKPANLEVIATGNGAMTSLDVSDNQLGAEGTKLLVDALKGNQIMMELNISSNYMTSGGMAGVVALAGAIPDMRALTKLMFGDEQAVTMTTEMTEAYFSGKLKSYEAQIVAAFLPKCR
jgi:Ran GTPase-activating protein (RanGAP) involved in mRNA processing and transport